MTDWQLLVAELDAWRAAGRVATLWLRDDDACAATPELARLLSLATSHRVPTALAVIPAMLEDSLAALTASHRCTLLQHGFAHLNHAPAGQRATELGNHRPVDACLSELASGWERVRVAAGAAAMPVLVPPWNRIAPAVVGRLPGIGLCGLSTFGPRASVRAAPGIVQNNAHVDLVDWRGSRGFVGEETALARLLAHLRARREHSVDTAESTGILSHHRVTDAAGWTFLDRLLATTRAHPAVDWLDAAAVFGIASAGNAPGAMRRATSGRSA